MTAERIVVTNARGESVTDILRRTGDFGVTPGDSDAAAINKLTGGIAASALATSRYFPSRAAGEADSEVDELFSTDDGAGQIIFYRRTIGGSVEVGKFVTPASLTGSIGADQLRDDAADLLAMAYKLGLAAAQDPLIPAVAIAFDFWTDAIYKAFDPMTARDLVGSYFVDYRTIDNFSETPPDSYFNLATKLPDGNWEGGVRSGLLLGMKQVGWTIGGYLGGYLVDANDDGTFEAEWNMPTLYSEDRVLAANYFKTIVDAFHDKGLDIASVAPNQRAWDTRLAGATRGLWKRVRAVSQTVPQPLPITDPMYIDKGSPPSLDNGDTPASVNATIDEFLAQPQPGLLTFVIHKIGLNTEDKTVSTEAFLALLDRLVAERAAGNLRVIGYDDIPVYR